jgi:TetR/AcrR family transcriptional repressor of lmrAB and yxaGH operons
MNAQNARNRILKAAKHLFQRRGYYAVGTAEILAEAEAPKGSMYHHFPDGKEQIAIAAVEAMSAEIAEMIATQERDRVPMQEMIRTLAKGMAQWLKASEWREGTMLASTSVGSVPDLPRLHAAIRNAFAGWRDSLTRILVRDGWKKSEAAILAQTIIATTEGAMILARIDQDERIVIRVSEQLARLVEREPHSA